MFGDNAPIWLFLKQLPHRQLPWDAVGADTGAYIMEVYPALMILGLFPVYFERGRLPKYNPANQKQFNLQDWQSLVTQIGRVACAERIEDLLEWARAMAAVEKPRKSDQDKVDAILCALQALLWWRSGAKNSFVIGDEVAGYMVSVGSERLNAIIREKARERNVPFNVRW